MHVTLSVPPGLSGVLLHPWSRKLVRYWVPLALPGAARLGGQCGVEVERDAATTGDSDSSLVVGKDVIVITFFWEGIGGAIVLLAGLVEQGSVILVAHGGLNPYILVFVFVGLASVYCWWRTHRLSLTQQAA